MHCLFQRNWHLLVREDKEKLLSEVTYCGSDGERCARLYVHPISFFVLDAQWEVYRTAEGVVNEILSVPQLHGLETYFNSGPALREALTPLQDNYAVPLFADAVRAIIQAETFLYRGRGFPSTDVYQEYWNNTFLNSCRYYSNLKRVTSHWYEHVGSDQRAGNLFNRMKSQFLYLTETGYRLSGHLNDSFHSLVSELELAEDGSTVIKAEGDLLRAPDAVCRESTRYMENLERKALRGLAKKGDCPVARRRRGMYPS
ncbi:MAG TPA: hypothetical protein DCQ14_07140, partial [Firmicutes bacterium]|nr:hypothetical protein [Bacillota bacterium]